MKTYIQIIIIGAFFLMMYPFLGLPELWENLYVILFGFAVGVSGIVLRYKSGLVKDLDDENSLQEYIEELRNKFNDSKSSNQDIHDK
jgi:hypothetical protein